MRSEEIALLPSFEKRQIVGMQLARLLADWPLSSMQHELHKSAIRRDLRQLKNDPTVESVVQDEASD